MNSLDIVFIVITCYFLLRGIYRGLIVEIASLVGVGLGFWLANSYYPIPARFVGKIVTQAGVAEIISFLAIFLATMVVVTLVATLIRRLLHIAMMGWMDHLAGSVVGLAKGALICCVILLVLTRFLPQASFVEESTLAPHLRPYAQLLMKLVPKPGELRNSDTTQS